MNMSARRGGHPSDRMARTRGRATHASGDAARGRPGRTRPARSGEEYKRDRDAALRRSRMRVNTTPSATASSRATRGKVDRQRPPHVKRPRRSQSSPCFPDPAQTCRPGRASRVVDREHVHHAAGASCSRARHATPTTRHERGDPRRRWQAVRQRGRPSRPTVAAATASEAGGHSHRRVPFNA
jgi:hypothetical protein